MFRQPSSTPFTWRFQSHESLVNQLVVDRMLFPLMNRKWWGWKTAHERQGELQSWEDWESIQEFWENITVNVLRLESEHQDTQTKAELCYKCPNPPDLPGQTYLVRSQQQICYREEHERHQTQPRRRREGSYQTNQPLQRHKGPLRHWWSSSYKRRLKYST